MKNLFKIAAVALFTMISVSLFAANDKNDKIAEVTYNVAIDCQNCVKKLEANLPFEKGVKDVKVSLDSKTVWFKYQTDKTDKQKLAKAIEKLGFAAKEVKNEDKK